MKAITFSLTTQQPLLATSFQGDPNSDVSYSYIPGSMIRGAIIGRYIKHYNLSKLKIEEEEVRNLFFDDEKAHYLNAYLESKEKEKKRTLPVPCSWVKDKDAEIPDNDSSPSMCIYDRASIDELSDELTPKSVEQNFCIVNNNHAILYAVKRRINIHNQRDRSKGRSMKDGEGEIFRYDAIDVGQTFQAVILCETEEMVNEILQLLQSKDDIWLGGSQSAGYGHCKITDVKCDRSGDWNEIGIPASRRSSQDDLVVTLLSSTIVRDDYGQPIADPKLVKREIEQALENFSLPETELVYAGSEYLGGFNRKWGLPLPQVPALIMGSVFVFKGFKLTEEQIKQLEAKGIGERRIDGFGRVAVNWLLPKSEFDAKKPDQRSKANQISLQGDSRNLAARMAERLLRQKLEQKLLEQIGRTNIQQGISNSQLSRLRLTARQALQNNGNLVISMLDDLPRNAQKQFETKIKVGNKETPLRSQLEMWLNNPREWITNLEVVKIANVEISLTNELAIEYTLRLVEAVAKKATKGGEADE